ncbi:MAG TPA: hypothetical protein VLB82_06595 [Thermodesulfobacteriota bacterium]|nr:hypothetical protein [Thermodesulfobacteriota bacterium]
MIKTLKEKNEFIYEYIIDSIYNADDPEYSDNMTDKEKLQYLYNTFSSEKGYEIPRRGVYKAFIDYMQGLGSSFNIAYTYNDIYELAYEQGSLSPDDNENKHYKIANNYYNYMATKVFELFSKHKILMPYKTVYNIAL